MNDRIALCHWIEAFIDGYYDSADVIVKRYLRHKGSYENCFLVRNGEQIPLNEIEDFLIL